jgi:tRNA dimethylallyltransferase
MIILKLSGLKMQLPEFPSPLVVVVGPTGVGKTALAIELAEHLKGEIVSADSRLFYSGMDVGTAKPTLKERNRIPHHLIDIVRPDETLSLAVFKKMAESAIDEIHEWGKVPLLVGGTGQYVQAIIQGWEIPEYPPNPQLRQALTNWANQVGPERIHDFLAILDPEAAQSIMVSNVRRTIRALEVIFQSGKRFSSQREKKGSTHSLLKIGLTLPRSILYARIDQRIDDMIAGGLVGEVQRLLSQGYTPQLPSFSAIGYREIASYLIGEFSLDEAILLMKRNTRTYVRRQANWFKLSDPTIRWFDLEQSGVSEILDWIGSGQGWQLPTISI